jgi:hypothetical protein
LGGGKSGHHAPHWSFMLRACFRGQSDVISSDQSNSLGVYAVALNETVKPIAFERALRVERAVISLRKDD